VCYSQFCMSLFPGGVRNWLILAVIAQLQPSNLPLQASLGAGKERGTGSSKQGVLAGTGRGTSPDWSNGQEVP
jgi:hypothetical protein